MTNAPERPTAIRHSFLIILRFNRDDDQNPLRSGVIGEDGKFRRMVRSRASLVVGVVDPSMRTASMPMTTIPLEGKRLTLYNHILDRVEELNHMYRGSTGYVNDPGTMNPWQSRLVIDKIHTIGDKIYGLLQSDTGASGVSRWLDELFRRHERDEGADTGEATHLTIVTNDFSIPWYWLSWAGHELFLCEVAALGTLQLSTYFAGDKGDADPVWRKRVAAENLSRALLINGSPTLPFTSAELEAVAAGLADQRQADDQACAVFPKEVSSQDDLVEHRKKTVFGQRVEEYRIVHFTGHYSPENLMIDGVPVDPREELDQFIDRAILVLDGCSSSKGLNAWTDVDSVTARLISLGAVGCIVTALPLKNDPIIADLFWRPFYSEMRGNGVTVGQALRHARTVLKKRLEELDICNPAWLLYQLIGNPTVDLFAESAGPR